MINSKVKCMIEAKNTAKITGMDQESMDMVDTDTFPIDGLV